MSYYFTFSLAVLFLGTALMVYVFIKSYNLPDYMVGLVGNVNKILVNAAYAFIKTPTQLYAVTLFDAFTGCTPIATRSIASKSVDSEELGKLFSVFGFADLAAPPVYAIIYGYFYTYTRESFTGAFFLLSYIFILPISALFIYSNRIGKSSENDTEDLPDETEYIEPTPTPNVDIATQAYINETIELEEKNISDILL